MIQECPECKSRNIKRTPTEIYCNDCGIVIDDELISYKRDWRSFSIEEFHSKAHTGPPRKYNIDGHDFASTLPYTYNTRKIKKIERQMCTDQEMKQMNTIMSFIHKYSSQLDVPKSIQEEVAFIIKKGIEMGILKRKTYEPVASAILYIVLRQHDIPRTLGEIEEVSNVSSKEISKYYKEIRRKMNIHLKTQTPQMYIPRFCSKLDVPYYIEKYSLNILDKNKHPVGSRPHIVAAAAIYTSILHHDYPITLQRVSEVTGGTTITIKKISNSFTIFHDE